MISFSKDGDFETFKEKFSFTWSNFPVIPFSVFTALWENAENSTTVLECKGQTKPDETVETTGCQPRGATKVPKTN